MRRKVAGGIKGKMWASKVKEGKSYLVSSN